MLFVKYSTMIKTGILPLCDIQADIKTYNVPFQQYPISNP